MLRTALLCCSGLHLVPALPSSGPAEEAEVSSFAGINAWSPILLCLEFVLGQLLLRLWASAGAEEWSGSESSVTKEPFATF